MSKGCSKCGMPNADNARFCRACGAAFDAATDAPEASPAPAEALCRACGHRNRPGARFCARCGTDQTPPAPVPVPPPTDILAPLPAAAAPIPPLPPLAPPAVATARPPMGLWIGLGAIVVALASGTAWWLTQARSQARPTFDAAPPPSVLGASSPTASASVPPPVEAAPAAPASVAPAIPAPPTDAASASASSLWEPADDDAPVAAAPARREPTTTNASQNARDARADALREQRARAAAPAGTPVPPRAVTAPPRATAPAAARTVQAHCANRNPLVQGICESRECVRPEHAGELVCQRIRAADDRRRQQEGGG